mgnify:CR=1 FL=1
MKDVRRDSPRFYVIQGPRGYWNNGAGCSIETLAELIGDTPKVAFDHYGKEWGQHYAEPLWAAIGSGKPTPERARVPKSKKAR